MKNIKMRIAWIVPNIICYLMFIGFSIFAVINAQALEETNRLSIWVIALLMVFFVSILGSYRIWSWIKHGKM